MSHIAVLDAIYILLISTSMLLKLEKIVSNSNKTFSIQYFEYSNQLI